VVARVPAALRPACRRLLRHAARADDPLVVAIKLAVFVAFGFYNRWWRYVSTRDMWGARAASSSRRSLDVPSTSSTAEHTSRLPRGVAAIDLLLLLAFVAGSRLLARTLIERPRGGIVARGKEVLIVGAGDAGQLIVREMQRTGSSLHADRLDRRRPAQARTALHGVRVLGTTDELAHSLRDDSRTRC
jgi:FlaA1/EpsC-like NDP-sugar epimerase